MWTGYAVALLFAVANAIWALGMPAGAPEAEVLAFYEDRAGRIVVGGSVSLLSIAMLIPFAAALRQLLMTAGASDWLATTAFAEIATTVVRARAQLLFYVSRNAVRAPLLHQLDAFQRLRAITHHIPGADAIVWRNAFPFRDRAHCRQRLKIAVRSAEKQQPPAQFTEVFRQPFFYHVGKLGVKKTGKSKAAFQEYSP